MDDDSRPLFFSEIFCNELAVLLPAENIPTSDPRSPEEAAEHCRILRDWVNARPDALGALCLSGGGIRSASFALGALQALARAGMLPRFHYLSTVSGGGYIGSWLTAFRHRAADDAAVLAALNQLADTGNEPAEIAAIRANSNYLTPRLGILSADTWTVLAHYVRNLVLNWAIFGPLFLAVLIVPQLLARMLAELAKGPAPWHHPLQYAAVAALLFGLSIAVCGRHRTRGNWLTDGWYLCGVLAPIIVAAICLTAIARSQPLAGWYEPVIAAALIYAGSAILGRLLAASLPGGAMQRIQPGLVGNFPILLDTLSWALSGAFMGLLVWVGLDLAGLIRTNWLSSDQDALLVIFGASWIVLAVLAGELLYTGLTSYSARQDMDQEWLARSAGWMAAAAASWAVLAALDLYGPLILVQTSSRIAILLAGGVSGIVALVFGASAKTAALVVQRATSKLTLPQLVGVAAVLFAAFLAILLSWVDSKISSAIFELIGRDRASEGFPSSGSFAMLGLALCLALLSLLLSVPINVNRFSLHALYRNRLIRAFLGAARGSAGRAPDPFTGFDPADNVAMAQSMPGTSMPGTGGPQRLLHVVNVALNVVSSRRLAWQERKAEAFSITALACGNPNVGYRRTAEYGARHGISLGTAMAISGAAVSPNQGYHSSPLVGFLLMLFNVRLGWWLGNPRYARPSRRDGPRLGLVPALQELAGATDDQRNWAYLSDGGHFENLGIYEMVRRRCRAIVVSDAGCDPQTRLEDLGNAVRKCFIDFGVRIEFDRLDLPARPGDKPPPAAGAAQPQVYCAIGRIIYPGTGPDGWILYVKPAYHGNEPADIRSYALAHPEFPHETTSDQWFSESQFEAYRSLGEHIFGLICGGATGEARPPTPSDLDQLHARAEAYITRSPEARSTCRASGGGVSE